MKPHRSSANVPPAERDWRDPAQTSGLTSRLILAYAERAQGSSAVDAILERCGLSAHRADLFDEGFWFDFSTKVRLFEAAAAVLDDQDAPRHIGEAAVDLSVFTGVKLAMRAVGNPAMVYSTLARHAWKFTTAHRMEVLELDTVSARLRYVDVAGVGYHRVDCEYNVGLLSCVPVMFGRSHAQIRHLECGLSGDEACVYDIRWDGRGSAVRRTATRWGGASAVAVTAAAAGAPGGVWTAAAVTGAGGAMIARRAMLERRRERDALATEVRDQKELAERLAASLRDLVSDLRVDEVLGKIVGNAQAALPGREFALLVLTDGGFHCRSSSRVPADSLRSLELWAERRADLLVERVTLNDLADEPSLDQLPTHPSSPLGALYSAPLAFRGKRLGVLLALTHGADTFVRQERSVLDAYADQAALALANARLFAQLEEIARRDSLTGLLNRREFHEALGREIERADHYGDAVSIAIFDLNGFKQVNDELGHGEGDLVLRGVAEALERARPEDATCYRLGGDEFGLLMPRLDGETGRAVAERAAEAIGRSGSGVTTAYGFAVWPHDGPSEKLLLFNADRALYESKESRVRATPAARRVESPATGGESQGQEKQRHQRTVTRALARAVDAKDSYTRSHCETVSELCGMIAEELDLGAERVARIKLAGLLHDVGKIGVPDAILQKPSPLTDDEFEVMKQHSTLGHTIVLGADLPEEAVWVRHHHERPDGRGYPEGLAGDDLPLESRIILVADAFEAITSDRPYRKGRPVRDALAELERCAGTQFDERCVAALRRTLGTGAREVFDPNLSITLRLPELTL